MLSKLEWQKTLREADDLSDAEFRVLVILSTYSDAKLSNARPGAERLARDTGISLRWVKASLAGLVKKGYLALDRQGGNALGKGRANVYSIVPKGALSTPFPDSKGELRDTSRVNCATEKGVLSAPHQVLSSGHLPAPLGDCEVCSRPYAACRRADEGAGAWTHEFTSRGTRQAS